MDAAGARDLAHAHGDAAAIRRVLDGDTQHFGDLVSRYQSSLYRHAVAMVLDHDVAMDMVHLDHLKDVRRRNVRLDDAGPLVDPRAGPSAIVERDRSAQRSSRR